LVTTKVNVLPEHPTMRHPHTDTPLRAVGVVGGRPVWPVMGASEDDTAGQDDAGGKDDKPDNDTGQEPATEKGKTSKLDGDFDKARAERLIENLRSDLEKEKGKRTSVETASRSQLDEIAKLLGFKKADDLDPTKLAGDLSAAKDAERATKVELAVFRSASKHGADADSLLDSRSFLDAVKSLDPASASFADDVETAIKNATKKNPKLKAAAPGPARSGGDMPGGPGSGRTDRPKSLTAAVGNHYRSGA